MGSQPTPDDVEYAVDGIISQHRWTAQALIDGRYRCLAGEAVFEVVEGFGEVVREPVFGV
jgi:hypothetical protein